MAYERLLPRRAIVLCYHAVTDVPRPHVEHLLDCRSARLFEADLDYLSANYRLPSFEGLLESSTSSRSAASTTIANDGRCAFVTFDDGLSECFDVVRPILLARKVPCAFFIPTDFIDGGRMFYRHKLSLCLARLAQSRESARQAVLDACRVRFGFDGSELSAFVSWLKALRIRDEAILDEVCIAFGEAPEVYRDRERPYLSTAQLRTLHEDGFVLGAHSRAHPDLGALADFETIEAEIVESCCAIQRITGAERIPFAFPFSGGGVSREVLDRIRLRNPIVGTIFDSFGVRRDDRRWNRIAVDSLREDGEDRQPLKSVIREAYVAGARAQFFW